ncbi:MAG: hypothetical protein R2762_20885 [Bryobacteraceae bacterium]
MPSWAQYLGWELSLAAACWQLSPRSLPALERSAFAIALNLCFASLLASALSFAGWNSPAAYLTIATALAVYALSRRDWTLGDPSAPGALAAAFLALLTAATIRPLEEVDSLYNLSYVVDWAANAATPYWNAYEYPAFWELTYLPAMILAKSAGVFWLQSLKPVVLLGCVLLLLARELGATRRLAIPAVAALLAFPHLWLIPSGVSTIKNDMIAAAGQALAAWLAVRAWNGGRDTLIHPVNAAWVAMAAIFLSAKALGLILLCAAFAAMTIWVRDTRMWRAAAWAFAAWMLAAGHFFVRKVWIHGNPFYPFEARLGPLVLPGTADLSSTSIRASVGDPRLWRLLFAPESGVSPLGVLFPLVVAAIVVGSLAVVTRAIIRRRWCAGTGMALVQLVCWGTYVVLPYSASAAPGDLHFLRHDLNSVRYVQGALLAAELYIAIRLWQSFPSLRWAIAGLMTLQAASRVWLIARRAPDADWLEPRHICVASVAAGCRPGFHAGACVSRSVPASRSRPRCSPLLPPPRVQTARLLSLPLSAPVWKPLASPRRQPRSTTSSATSTASSLAGGSWCTGGVFNTAWRRAWRVRIRRGPICRG